MLPTPISSRVHLRDFISYVHEWSIPPHQESWVEAMQDLADGVMLDDEGQPCNRLMILAPPASGKSDTVCQFAEWLIGREVFWSRDPQVGYLSYSDSIAWTRSVAIRDTIAQHERYREVFPYTMPAKEKGWGRDEWFLQRIDPGKKDPTFRAAGFSGTIYGYRLPTLVVIDDPQGGGELQSASAREQLWFTWNTVIKTRATEWTPIVLIATRNAADDLPGRIMEVEKGWKVIRTPALDEEGRSYWSPALTPLGMPVGISTAALQQIKETHHSSFLTQYMCLPPHEEGDVFKWWNYMPWPSSELVERVYQYWDTAVYDRPTSDFQAMVEILHLKNGQAFISHVVHDRMDTPTLMGTITSEYQRAVETYGNKVIIKVENKSSGGAVVDMVRMNSGVPIRAINPIHKKLLDRANAITPFFEAGRVCLPVEFLAWKEKYLQQLKSYPRGRKHEDDLVSATVLGVEDLFLHTMGRPRGFNIIHRGFRR